MVVAMMVPATIPVAARGQLRQQVAPSLPRAAAVRSRHSWRCGSRSERSRSAHQEVAAALGTGHAIHGAVATAAILLVAANWQLFPHHRRYLKRCRRTLPLGARGQPADRACLRYGLYHVRQCAGACWPLMLAMIPGHSLALMVALTALTTWQRLARRPNRSACPARSSP